MTLLRALVAFLLPPAGLHLGRAARTGALIVSAIWVLGQLTFWFAMAGPGFLIALAASLAAVVMVVLARRKGRA